MLIEANLENKATCVIEFCGKPAEILDCLSKEDQQKIGEILSDQLRRLVASQILVIATGGGGAEYLDNMLDQSFDMLSVFAMVETMREA